MTVLATAAMALGTLLLKVTGLWAGERATRSARAGQLLRSFPMVIIAAVVAASCFDAAGHLDWPRAAGVLCAVCLRIARPRTPLLAVVVVAFGATSALRMADLGL